MAASIEALKQFRTSSDFFSEKWPADGDPKQWEGITIEGGLVTSLKVAGTYLARNRLPFLPPDVKLLVDLRLLELAWCKRLSQLPPEIGMLKNLKALGISGCQQVEALTPAIGELKMLATLDLSQCRSLKTLPAEIGNCTALKSIICTDCTELAALPPECGKLVSLSSIVLSGCEHLKSPPKDLHKAPCEDVVGYSARHATAARHFLTRACMPATAQADITRFVRFRSGGTPLHPAGSELARRCQQMDAHEAQGGRGLFQAYYYRPGAGSGARGGR